MWLSPCLYLVLLAAAPAYLLLPCAPYASGRAGMGKVFRLDPLVGYTPLLTRFSLCFLLCGVARHVTYLHLCLCVCAPSSPFLSLHTMLLVRGVGGRVVLAAACLYSHTLRSICVQACGGGHGHSWWRRLRVYVSVCHSWVVCVLAYLSLPLLACQREHGSRLHHFGYLRALHVTYLRLCWRLGALSGGVWLPPCLQLALCAAAYLLLPMQAGMRGGACLPGFTSWLPLLARLTLCFSRSVACNIIGALSRWPVWLLLLLLVWFVFCFCFFCSVFCFCVFVFACVVLSLGCVWFSLIRPSYHSLTLRGLPYHFAFPRQRPCCACGCMYVRVYIPFAPYVYGLWGWAWSLTRYSSVRRSACFTWRWNTGGIPFAPYVSGCAGVGTFSLLHLLVTFVGLVIVVLFPLFVA